MNKRMMSVIGVLLGVSLHAGCVAQSARPDVSAFEPIPSDFVHHWDHRNQPFTGAAVIDVNGDGRYEVFVGGGEGQSDVILSMREGRLVNIGIGRGLSSYSATHGATAIDMNQDGATDLLIARRDGVFLYLNRNGEFERRRIPVALPEDSVPFHVAVSDIDRDGDGDLYISTFVTLSAFRSATFNAPDHAKTNRLLLNNGDLTFKDITETAGVAGKQNSFCATFIDLDNDDWQDLVVAQNTGEVEIFRNDRDRTFTPVATRSGYGFWMGLGVGDMDNDGDQDLFFPNVGSSIPELLTRGDIRKDQRHTHDWLVLQNDGDFTFRDVTEDYGITREGFAWGGVFEDLDLDGNLDLFVAQNYAKWPFHHLWKLEGRTYLQQQQAQGRKFRHVPALGLENEYFGQSSIIADLDGDGRQDYIWINIAGPVRAFRNTAKGNFLTIRVPDNVAFLGTRIHIETERGHSYTREVVAGEGFLTDQTPERTFGLGALEKVDRVVVHYPTGAVEVMADPRINSTITLR